MKTTLLMAVIAAGFSLTALDVTAESQHQEIAFADIDTNGDGLLTPEELAAQGVARAQARFDETDTNGDNMLSAEELLAHAQGRNGDRASRHVERMLSHLDENDDGSIQRDEMPEPREGHGARRFERADANDDGAISEDEFDAAREGHNGRGDRRGGPKGEGRHAPRGRG